MELSTNTIYTDLVINRLKRNVYNELLLSNEIYKDQIYLIEDEDYDVFNKRIVNVSDPSADYDAVNLNYLNQNYYSQEETKNIINNTKIEKLYYGNIVHDFYDNNSKYIDGSGDIYLKNTDDWQISATGVESSNVTLHYRTGFGWLFKINGSDFYNTGDMNEYPDFLSASGSYGGSDVSISAYSWKKTDKLIKASELSNYLISCTTFDEFRLCVLNSLK